MYEEVVEASACGPERPLACLYDFLAIGSRTGAVLEDLAGRGWSVGPLISDFGALLTSPFFAGLGALPHRGGPR